MRVDHDACGSLTLYSCIQLVAISPNIMVGDTQDVPCRQLLLLLLAPQLCCRLLRFGSRSFQRFPPSLLRIGILQLCLVAPEKGPGVHHHHPGTSCRRQAQAIAHLNFRKVPMRAPNIRALRFFRAGLASVSASGAGRLAARSSSSCCCRRRSSCDWAWKTQQVWIVGRDE